MLQWVVCCYFGVILMDEMVGFGFLIEVECNEFNECLYQLWCICFVLYFEFMCYDNCLFFDCQFSVVCWLGYEGDGNQLIEYMMKDFFCVICWVSELNQMLFQLFEEVIFVLIEDEKLCLIDDDFQLCGIFIDLCDDMLFICELQVILCMFYIMVCNSIIIGIYLMMLCYLCYVCCYFIQLLCYILEVCMFFFSMLCYQGVVSCGLLLMYCYSVLWVYMLQWLYIVGQMQFDLFYVYIVDEYIVWVMFKLESFVKEEICSCYLLCVELWLCLMYLELILIVVLFYDIVKGCGGDYLIFGVQDVLKFVELYGLNLCEMQLVVWLVCYYLLMLVIVQWCDIQDLEVIKQFVEEV